ncbi:flagellar basal body rod protein FlgB [Roseateles chitinivorans]|uniref:flagellar basal body rod protein FlgB n=1 Tax=Roseateles chitinivorans TaxID=2917965 RepID=UPI00261576B4|nr:flagellar basal body rod protein FlgB [uncultured Roseateles sp.]
MDGIKDTRINTASKQAQVQESEDWRSQALVFRGKRQAMLASNIANADTPNYKARDISFAEVLRASSLAADAQDQESKESSSAREVPLISPSTLAFAGYRQPLQDSIDGNTVELEREQAEFARNTILYTLAMTSLDDEAQEFKQATALPSKG